MEKVGHAKFNKNTHKNTSFLQEFYALFSEFRKIGEFVLRSTNVEILEEEFEKLKKRAKKLTINYFYPALDFLKNNPDISNKTKIIAQKTGLNDVYESFNLGEFISMTKAQRSILREEVKEIHPFIPEYLSLSLRVINKRKEPAKETPKINATDVDMSLHFRSMMRNSLKIDQLPTES